MSTHNFYTYVLLDPRKSGRYTFSNFISFLFEPFYVGKGLHNRLRDHINEAKRLNSPETHKIHKIRKLLNLNLLPIELKVHTGLTEEQSFIFEKYLITVIGRVCLSIGPLTNLTDGGDGPAGRKCSEETKEKLSKVRMGKKVGPMKDETKMKISKSNIGKKRTEAQCKHSSEINRGKWLGDKNPSKLPEIKELRRLAMIGKKNPMFGKSGILHPMFGIKRPENSGDKNSSKRSEVRMKLKECWDTSRKNKHSNRMQGSNNPASKAVVVRGSLYMTIKEASIEENISLYLIHKNISKNLEGFCWA